MTRAHAVAAVVEDAADQQSAGVCPSCIALALLSKFLLNGIKQVSIEDRRVFCGADLAFEHDLSDVEAVAQEIGERAPCERNATYGSTIGERAGLGDDFALSKVNQEQPDAAEVEVAPEDGADPFGLFLLDEELPVPTNVAERHHAADP
jgi:hypothetical protein